MKITNSIITRVTLLFVFSSVCFVLFVLYFIESQKRNDENVIKARYESVIFSVDNLIIKGGNIDSIREYLQQLNFTQIDDAAILDKAKSQYFLLHGVNSMIAINTKNIDGHYYVALHDTIDSSTFLFSDYTALPSYTNYYIIALIAFITLVFFYVIVLNSLLPLNDLRKEVLKFSSGDMNIVTISHNNDEIGSLSEEFTKAAKIISEMAKARTLFLRAIMHELKTPITKGFLILEMMEDSKFKTRIDTIFKRLNEIINSFAIVERIDTKNYKPNMTDFSIIELMQNVNRMLIIEYERPRNVILENRDCMLYGDIELMSLGVKNLVDNASKYASDKLVKIFVENRDLVIQNKGAPFKNDISEYFQPFFNDGSKSKHRSGLGLGMYIIKNTIEAQGYAIEYKYEQNCHYFYIKNCIIS